jgi:hypothetical protein
MTVVVVARCKVCGQSFTGWRGRKLGWQYCSYRCHKAAYRGRVGRPRVRDRGPQPGMADNWRGGVG